MCLSTVHADVPPRIWEMPAAKQLQDPSLDCEAQPPKLTEDKHRPRNPESSQAHSSPTVNQGPKAPHFLLEVLTRGPRGLQGASEALHHLAHDICILELEPRDFSNQEPRDPVLNTAP